MSFPHNVSTEPLVVVDSLLKQNNSLGRCAKLWNRLVQCLFCSCPSIIKHFIIKNNSSRANINSRSLENCEALSKPNDQQLVSFETSLPWGLQDFYNKLIFLGVKKPTRSTLHLLIGGNIDLLHDKNIMCRIALYLACARTSDKLDLKHCHKVVIGNILDKNMVDLVKNNVDFYHTGLLLNYTFRLSSQLATIHKNPTMYSYFKKKISFFSSLFLRYPEIIRTKAVGPLFDTEEYLNFQFKSNNKMAARIHRQARILNKDFYYQPVRGEGNCFYLAYLSGWLHAIIRENSFDDSINKLLFNTEYRNNVLERNSFDCTDIFVDFLKKLKKNPSHETIRSLLEKDDTADLLASYFRDFAIFGVKNAVEILVDTGRFDRENNPILEYVHQPLGYRLTTENNPSGRHVWNNENLVGFYIEDENNFVGGILDNNDDLKKSMITTCGQLNKENYCIIQGKNFIDVQRPEIAILNNHFSPITIYQRMDIPQQDLGSREDGRLDSFGTNNGIVLFRSNNHFDSLIPRNQNPRNQAPNTPFFLAITA